MQHGGKRRAGSGQARLSVAAYGAPSSDVRGPENAPAANPCAATPLVATQPSTNHPASKRLPWIDPPTPASEWRRVDGIEPGSRVSSAGERAPSVARIVFTRRHDTVYNFGVREFRSYFVGESAAWVHNCPDELKFADEGKFGKKMGKHGVHAYEMTNPEEYRKLANQVFENPDEIRKGGHYPNAPGGTDSAYFFKRGEDLLIVEESGEFRSLYPAFRDGGGSTWWRSATEVGE